MTTLHFRVTNMKPQGFHSEFMVNNSQHITIALTSQKLVSLSLEDLQKDIATIIETTFKE